VPTPLSGLRIFLASPSGLDFERDLVAKEIALFNEVHGLSQGVAFFVIRWENLALGAGRPQARINPHVASSDFFLMLVGDHLGSATTPTPPYRTGVEEELSTSAVAIGDLDSPMADIALMFRSPSERDLLNPTDKYKQVQEFRHGIESTKELSYCHFETHEDLRYRLALQLGEWKRYGTPKVPVALPRTLAYLERAEHHSMAEPPSDRPDDLVRWAEVQAQSGLITIADKAFATAASHSQPDHLLRYARFLQRTGQLERAFEVDQRVVVATDGGTNPNALGQRTRALANMGLVRRKQGDLAKSLELLSRAVEIGARCSADQPGDVAYALDQLGITQLRLGDLDGARASYQSALDLRSDAGDSDGRAQSLINLARIDRQVGDSTLAVSRLEEAVDLLEHAPNEPTLANALSGLGSLLIRTHPARARDVLDRALQLNEKLKLLDGVSVTSNDLARLCLSLGDIEEAADHATKAMQVSTRTGNKEG